MRKINGVQKRIVTLVSICLIAVLLIGLFVRQEDITAYAQESFTGIDAVINTHDSSNPFTVIEIVPDQGMSKLGYLVGGSEPFSYTNGGTTYTGGYEAILAQLTSTADRNAAVGSLTSTYASLIATDDTKPITSSTYEESYAKKEGFKKVSLNTAELIASGTTGYKMESVSDNSGEYVKHDSSYTPVAGGVGDTNENILYYSQTSGLNKYYNVTFAHIDDTFFYSGPIYQVKAVTYIKPMNGEDGWSSSVLGYDNGAIVYADANIDGSYAQHPFSPIAKSDSIAHQYYYEVTFEYVANTADSEFDWADMPTDCYSVNSVTFCADATGEYGAVVNANTPYVATPGGNFTSSGAKYTYVGTGGNYNLVAGEASDSVDANVEAPCIYYKGGLTNNEFFKNAVFNQSGLLDGDTDIAIQVLSMTPSEFATYIAAEEHNLNQLGMVYLSNSSSYASGTPSSYVATTNDLSAKLAVDLYKAAISSEVSLPIVVDSSLIALSSSTNIGKLAEALTSEEPPTDAFVLDDNNELETYTAPTTDQKFADANNDNYYVNRNILFVPADGANYKELKSDADLKTLAANGDKYQDATFDFLSDLNKVFLKDISSLNNKFTYSFVGEAEALGFGAVASMIKEENLYREVENRTATTLYGYFDQTISRAIALEYIISYSSRRSNDAMTSIKVLDIEPCNITSDSKNAIETTLNKYLGITTESGVVVTYTHMSSAEFIGKIEDLNDYDMIYLGLSTDMMNKNSSGRTVYNDSSMNGLIYTNIGDLQSGGTYRGALDNDYSSAEKRGDNNGDVNNSSSAARYSGNDFTIEKKNALIAFANSGAPIIMHNNFLTSDGRGGKTCYDYTYNSDGTRKTSAGNGYIDNCSYVYETINAIKDLTNVYTESDFRSPDNVNVDTRTSLLWYLNLGKPVLNISGYSPNNRITMTGDTISMDFYIQNSGAATTAATFNCILYIDFNADGRYAASERVSAKDYNVTKGGVAQTYKTATDSDGSYNYYELTTNTADSMYHLTYNVANSYIGMLPVKVVIAQNNNQTTRYDSKILYYYHPNQQSEPKKIRILQILPSSVGDGDLIDLDLTGTVGGGNRIDSEKYKNRSAGNYYKETLKGKSWGELITWFSTSAFKTQLDALEAQGDFDIEIDSVYADRFYQALSNQDSARDLRNKLFVNADSEFYFSNYDMLIVGFSDSGTYQTNSNRDQTAAIYEKIHEFIATGKSVLFAHDVTGSSSNPNSKGFGFTLNKWVAADSGMDRYGIYAKNASNVDASVTATGIDDITKNSTNSLIASNYYSLKNLANASQLNTYGKLYDAIISNSKTTVTTGTTTTSYPKYDVAYQPNSAKNTIVRETQGRNTWTLNHHASSDTGGYGGGTIYSNMVNAGKNYWTTNTVEVLNYGQILMYPFNIVSTISANNNKMSIATTHAQYFQLNLNADADQDGQGDMTVWFTLSPDTTNSMFNYSKGDARNNYYIYTKGNVTYSGVGHRNFNQAAYVTEVQLYLNTIITAYNAGCHAPDISVKKTADPNSETLTTLYSSVDASISSGEVSYGGGLDSGNERVYFRIDDTNNMLGGTKVLAYNVYMAFDTEAEAKTMATAKSIAHSSIVHSGSEYLVPLNLSATSTVTGAVKTPFSGTAALTNNTAYAMNNGEMYYMDVPLDLITYTSNGQADIRLYASVTVYEYAATVASGTYTGKTDFYIQKIGLFDLD